MFRTIQYRDGVLLNILYDEHNSHLKNKIFREGLQLLTPWISKVIEEGVQKKNFSISNPGIVSYFIMSILRYAMDETLKDSSSDRVHTYFEVAARLIERILQIPEHTLCLHIECIRRAT